MLRWHGCDILAASCRRSFLSSVGSCSRLGRFGAGCGTLAGAWSLWFGFCLRFRVRFCIGRGFGSGRAALWGVVVHVPTGTLEAQAGYSESPLQDAAALGTDLLRFGAEVLDFLKSMAALRAAIRIQRQGFLSPRRRIIHVFSILPGGRRLRGKSPPLGEAGVNGPTRSQCTRMGTDALMFSQASVSVPLPPPLSVIV